MILYMVDAMEGREVSTSDLTGTFLQTNYDQGYIHINMEGTMVALHEEIDPDYYKDFICEDKCGRKYMYAESKKAIYTLEASLIFWAKLLKILEEMGYQRNECN